MTNTTKGAPELLCARSNCGGDGYSQQVGIVAERLLSKGMGKSVAYANLAFPDDDQRYRRIFGNILPEFTGSRLAKHNF